LSITADVGFAARQEARATAAPLKPTSLWAASESLQRKEESVSGHRGFNAPSLQPLQSRLRASAAKRL
jgi:hypothetical protein